MKEIIVVDDHPLYTRGLKDLVGSTDDLRIVGEAHTTSAGMELIRQHQAALLVTELALKDRPGLDFVREVRGDYPAMSIAVLSRLDPTLYRVRALRAGASTFLSKALPAGQVLDGLRTSLDNGGGIDATKQHAEEPRSPLTLLSDRELEVFRRMGHGSRTRDVADELGISVKTVETHQAHIKKKLGLKNSIELLRAAVIWVAEIDAEA